jgi:tetratricopeptide (TPR) repeat protein
VSAIALAYIRGKGNQGDTKALEAIAVNWESKPISLDAQAWRKSLIATLEHHRYPMSNRVMALKVLVDDTYVDPNDNEEAVLEEFVDLEKRHRSSWHFTPFELGCTLALTKKKEAAIEALERSLQMISMQPAYYEAIADMYYLYDDFNDRRIHYKHALQMASADLTQKLLDNLRNPKTNASPS